MDRAADANRLVRQVIGYARGWTALLTVAALTGAVAELLLPSVLGHAVDAALGTDDAWWPVAAAGLIVLLVAADALTDLASGHGNAAGTARLRGRLVRHLFALEPATAARYPVGDLVGRLAGQSADAGQAGTTVALGLVSLLPPLGSVVALGLLQPSLGVTFVAGLVVLTLLMRRFVRDSSAATGGYLRVQGTIAGRLLEALTGARTIAAAGTTDAEIERVLAPLPGLREYGRRTWTVLAQAAARNAAVAPLLQLLVVAVGGWSVTTGTLTPGELLAAMQYAALGSGVGAVLATLNRLVRTRTGAARVAEVLALPARSGGTGTLPPGPGRLTLRGVGVRAPDGRPILDDVELDVPGGVVLAVVGASGAGKSTLAEVAGGLRTPDRGQVLLDGTPLAGLGPGQLRSAVGHGFARPVLVGATVGEALGLALDDISATSAGGDGRAEAVARVARDAAIADFIERLPQGYRTPLDRTPLSGGEAQRLGLARALHAQRLLILDDATSSVDAVTEERIIRALTSATDGRTRLIVTHRRRTAAAADLVAWLDRGRLRALDRHDTLWARPDYRALFQTVGEPAGVGR